MKYIIAGLGNFGASLAEKLTAKGNEVIGIDTFGESAPANVLFEHFGFTVANVVKTVKRVL